MADLTPDTFRELNVEHRYRPAAVVIRKPLLPQGLQARLLEEVVGDPKFATASHPQILVEYNKRRVAAYVKRKGLYKEFIKNGTISVVDESVEDRTFDANRIFGSSVHGFYIITNNIPLLKDITGLAANPVVLSEALNPQGEGSFDITNQDIESIQITRQTRGASMCNLSLRNIGRKYVFQDDLSDEITSVDPRVRKLGQPVFEPLDEITVWLPSTPERIAQMNQEIEGTSFKTDPGDELVQVYKGLISKIDLVTSNGYHSINLTCEDFIKKLRISRTNTQPSLDPKEAGFAAVSAFSPAWAQEDPPEVFCSTIFAQALSNVYTELREDGQTDDLIRYLRERRKRPDGAKDILSALLREYVQTTLQENGSQVGSIEGVTVVSSATGKVSAASQGITGPVKLRNDEIANAGSARVTPVYVGSLRRRSNISFTQAQASQITGVPIAPTSVYEETETFMFAGTTQPVYQWQWIGQWRYFDSDWKANIEIIEQVAQTLNYNYYTEPTGLIKLTPPELTLRSLNNLNGDNTSAVNKWKQNNPHYITTPKVIASTQSLDDTRLFNYVVVSGDYQELSIPGLTFGNVGISAIQPLIDSYGIRMLKTTNVVGITNGTAAVAYARSILDRQNREILSTDTTVIGDALLDVDGAIYMEENNTVYYVSALSHSYVAGGTYTTGISGTWGRAPLIKLKSPANANIGGRQEGLTNRLNSLLSESAISLSTHTKYSHMNRQDTLVEALWFEGYIWEDPVSLVFEDVFNSMGILLRAEIEKLLGKEIFKKLLSIGKSPGQKKSFLSASAAQRAKILGAQKNLLKRLGAINTTFFAIDSADWQLLFTDVLAHENANSPKVNQKK
jgi:hypothetical protein